MPELVHMDLVSDWSVWGVRVLRTWSNTCESCEMALCRRCSLLGFERFTHLLLLDGQTTTASPQNRGLHCKEFQLGICSALLKL